MLKSQIEEEVLAMIMTHYTNVMWPMYRRRLLFFLVRYPLKFLTGQACGVRL